MADDTVLRQRKTRITTPSAASTVVDRILDTVQACDALQKADEEAVVRTETGGAFSVAFIVLVAVLIVSEIYHYNNNIAFHYTVDTDFESARLPIHLDMTVAMPCALVGADFIDSTMESKSSVDENSTFHEEDVRFEMSHGERRLWQAKQRLNTFVREKYHSTFEFVYRTGYLSAMGFGDALDDKNEYAQSRQLNYKQMFEEGREPNACRIYGSVVMHKLPGQFHVLQGKSMNHPLFHAHITMTFGFGPSMAANFSHRIHKLAFGDYHTGFVQPLDAEEKIAPLSSASYEYTVQVVPTTIKKPFLPPIHTYQYSVTSNERLTNHSEPGHSHSGGSSGIFIKYKLSPIKVVIDQGRISIGHAVSRLCGVIGGCFAIFSLLTVLANSLRNLILPSADPSYHCLPTKNKSGSVAPLSPIAASTYNNGAFLLSGEPIVNATVATVPDSYDKQRYDSVR